MTPEHIFSQVQDCDALKAQLTYPLSYGEYSDFISITTSEDGYPIVTKEVFASCGKQVAITSSKVLNGSIAEIAKLLLSLGYKGDTDFAGRLLSTNKFRTDFNPYPYIKNWEGVEELVEAPHPSYSGIPGDHSYAEVTNLSEFYEIYRFYRNRREAIKQISALQLFLQHIDAAKCKEIEIYYKSAAPVFNPVKLVIGEDIVAEASIWCWTPFADRLQEELEARGYHRVENQTKADKIYSRRFSC